MNTVVVFQSDAFNHSRPKPYYVNPCCYGDDLARWLMGELVTQGVVTDLEPGQEDFGWYFEASVDGEKSCLVITGDGEGGWFVVVERSCGLIASLLGGRHRGVGTATIAALENVLERSKRIRNLRWTTWAAFRSGDAA